MWSHLLLLVLVTIASWVPLIAIYRHEMHAFMRPRLVAAPDVLYDTPYYSHDWIGPV